MKALFNTFLNKINLNKKIFLIIAGLLVITISAAITYFFARPKPSSDSENFPEVLSAQTELDISQTPPEDLKTLTVLLLGYGGAGHQGGFLTDVIQLVHINFQKAQISLISVPRDLWVKLPSGKQAKINTAFTLGENPNQPIASGGQVAKQMASNVTSIPIDYFVAVDFVGFKRLIGEELDGLEVNVPETLDDPWYPIQGEELNPCGMTPQEVADLTTQYSGFELEKQFECRYKHLYFKKGLVEMEGGDALGYVRSRHGSAGGDFSRSQRQHALLKAISDKLWSIEALEKAPEFFEKTAKHFTTDIDLEIIKYLIPALKATGDFETKNMVLSTENVFTTSRSSTGQSIVVPKTSWSAVHQFVQSNL
ncbi:LCP family protein [Patescibacteria group bacterium]|nr:LCP family protein [Patescibacteria group bacterium]MBU1885422.1 LCP family protein [Patescibacteria group bacterium]